MEYTFDRPYSETGGEACASFEIGGLDVTWMEGFDGSTDQGIADWHMGDRYSIEISRPEGETGDVKLLASNTYDYYCPEYPGGDLENAFTASCILSSTDLVFCMQTAEQDDDETTITAEYTYNTLASHERFIFSGADGDTWLEADVVVEPDAKIRTDPRTPEGAFINDGMIYWYDADGDARTYEVGFVFTDASKAHVDANGDPAPVAIGFFIDYNSNHRFDANDSFFKTTWLNSWEEYDPFIREKAEYDAWGEYCKQFDGEYLFNFICDLIMGIAINIATRGQGKSVQTIINLLYGVAKGAMEVAQQINEANAYDYSRAVSISRRTDWGWIQGDFFIPEYPYSNIPIVAAGAAGPVTLALPRMSFGVALGGALGEVIGSLTGTGQELLEGIDNYNVWQAGFMRLLQEMRIPDIDMRWYEQASKNVLGGFGAIQAQLSMWKMVWKERGASNPWKQGISMEYLRHVLHAGFRMYDIPDAENAIEQGIHDAFDLDFKVKIYPAMSEDGRVYYTYAVDHGGSFPPIMDATHPALVASAVLSGEEPPGGLYSFVHDSMLPTRWYRYGLTELTWGDALDPSGKQDGTGFFDYAAAPIPVSIPYLLDYNVACLASAYETAREDYTDYGLGIMFTNMAIELVATLVTVAATTGAQMASNPNLLFLDKGIFAKEFMTELAEGLFDELIKEAGIKLVVGATWNVFDQVVIVGLLGLDDRSAGWGYYQVIKSSIIEQVGENLEWGGRGGVDNPSNNKLWLRNLRHGEDYMVDRWARILAGSQQEAARNLEAMINYLETRGATDEALAKTVQKALVLTRFSFMNRIRESSAVGRVMSRAGIGMEAVGNLARDPKARLERFSFDTSRTYGQLFPNEAAANDYLPVAANEILTENFVGLSIPEAGRLMEIKCRNHEVDGQKILPDDRFIDINKCYVEWGSVRFSFVQLHEMGYTFHDLYTEFPGAKIYWYDPGAGGPPSDHPMWLALPLRFQSPERLLAYAQNMEQTGQWTHAQVVTFMQVASPAYTVNEWFGRDINTGQLPANELERAVNMLQRLGLIPGANDPDPAKARTARDTFRDQFQHATNAWYPVGMLPAFIEMYCTIDTLGRFTGFYPDVQEFLDGTRDRLPTPYGPDLVVEHALTPAQRIALWERECRSYGLAFTYPPSGYRLSIDTTLSQGMSFVMPGGSLSALTGDQNGVLRIRDYVARDVPNAILNGYAILSIEAWRRILYLGNGPFRLTEQTNYLRYHARDGLTNEESMAIFLRGGLGEFFNLDWLTRIVDQGAASISNWGILGDRYSPQGNVEIEAGRTYFGTYTGSHIIEPDFVLWDRNIDLETGLSVDYAAVSEEVDTTRNGDAHSIEALLHMARDLIGITRACNPDLSGLGPNPTAAQVAARRNAVYRGTVLRVLSGTDFQSYLTNALTAGSTLNSGNIRIERLSASGGIRGVMRINDGDATLPACHVIFEIVPNPNSALPNSYIVRMQIGRFSNQLQPGEVPQIAQAQLDPTTIWYDSTDNPTFLRILPLLDNLNLPFSAAAIDAGSGQFAAYLRSVMVDRGFSISQRQMVYIREHDAPTYHLVLESIFPAYVHSGQGYSPSREGEYVNRFRFDVVLDVEARTGERLVLPLAWDDNSLDTENAWRSYTNVPHVGFSVYTLNAPAIRARQGFRVWARSAADVRNLEARIAQEFQLADVSANRIINRIFFDGFWQQIHNPSGWNPNRDIPRVESWIRDTIQLIRSYIRRSAEFTMEQDKATNRYLNAAMENFFQILRAIPAGYVFPDTYSLQSRSAHENPTTVMIVNAWFAMWESMFASYDADYVCFTKGRGKVDHIDDLRRAISFAIVYDWRSADDRVSIFREYFARLSAFTQLQFLASDNGWGVIDIRPIADASGGRVIGGWSYARVLYASPSGPVREFMVRYRPDSNLESVTGSGFMVFAENVGGTWAPTQPVNGQSSPDPVSLLYNIISGLSPIPNRPGTNQPFASLAEYLDSLAQVQVGGMQGSGSLSDLGGLNQ
jgi:hypothetical protein